jgi:hypothetical protein
MLPVTHEIHENLHKRIGLESHPSPRTCPSDLRWHGYHFDVWTWSSRTPSQSIILEACDRRSQATGPLSRTQSRTARVSCSHRASRITVQLVAVLRREWLQQLNSVLKGPEVAWLLAWMGLMSDGVPRSSENGEPLTGIRRVHCATPHLRCPCLSNAPVLDTYYDATEIQNSGHSTVQ